MAASAAIFEKNEENQMETVEQRNMPLWQPSFHTEQINTNISGSFSDRPDELQYEVKNAGSGRSMDMIEELGGLK